MNTAVTDSYYRLRFVLAALQGMVAVDPVEAEVSGDVLKGLCLIVEDSVLELQQNVGGEMNSNNNNFDLEGALDELLMNQRMLCMSLYWMREDAGDCPSENSICCFAAKIEDQIIKLAKHIKKGVKTNE